MTTDRTYIVNSIDAATHFIAIVTKKYLADPHCVAQLERAQSLQKPMLLFVEIGNSLPNWILECADIVMFDNMLPPEVAAKIAISWVTSRGKRNDG